jgi:hypothetical protein
MSTWYNISVRKQGRWEGRKGGWMDERKKKESLLMQSCTSVYQQN